MPSYSKKSAENLNTCHADLIRLFITVILYYNCSILCGFRGEKEQNEAFDKGRSKLRFPNSAHNRYPSRAVDAIFWPFNEHSWDDREKFMEFRGFVYGVASQLGISLKKTIQWDLPHFELKDDVRSGIEASH